MGTTVPAVTCGLPPKNKRVLIGLALLAVLAAMVILGLLLWRSDSTRPPLNDSQISAFLQDNADPDGIEFALAQIQIRLSQGERLDRWAPELVRLAHFPMENIRYSVAQLMGADPSRPDFHQTLLGMLRFETMLVRNAAALSLVDFGDSAGREQIVSMLQSVSVDAPRPGYVQTATHAGARITHGSVMVHLQSGNTVFDVLAPITGRVRELPVQDGDIVPGGTRIAVLEPDSIQVLAALSALEKIGEPQDLVVLANLENSSEFPPEVRERAKLTEEQIKRRTQHNVF